MSSVEHSVVPGPGVLVVNSDPAARMRIAAVLAAARFDVSACATAAEALALLKVAPRSALVVASSLDDMGGVEFMQACSAANLAPTTIVTSRKGEITAAVLALREGAEDYVPEPIDERLALSLRRALSDHAKRPLPSARHLT